MKPKIKSAMFSIHIHAPAVIPGISFAKIVPIPVTPPVANPFGDFEEIYAHCKEYTTECHH